MSVTVVEDFAVDIAAIQSIDAVPKILDVICRVTGMGFAAVARVTEGRWICCAVKDDIQFGLQPGGELEVESTICHEIRQRLEPVVIENVALDQTFCNHHTPARYGFQSYFSQPIFLPDGTFFGTLCAIDPHPRVLKTAETTTTFRLFAELIGIHLASVDKLSSAQIDLSNERQTSELREQFIAVLGHDLRNPLASVAAVARRFRKAKLTEDEFNYLDILQNSVRRMAGLVDNLMDFARGRLGGGLTLNKAKVDLAPAIRQIISELQPDGTELITFKNEMRLPVDCDPDRIAQLLSNLLGNALTHGDPKKPIMVEAKTSLQQFELSVTNSGHSISEKAMEGLFMPFARGKTGEGLGLGLFIASEIARAHSGLLSVVSAGGTTSFTLTLPLGN